MSGWAQRDAERQEDEAGFVEWLQKENERLQKENERLRATLTWVLNDIEQWCWAVEEDASWDGWDEHYKSFRRGGIENARKEMENA